MSDIAVASRNGAISLFAGIFLPTDEPYPLELLLVLVGVALIGATLSIFGCGLLIVFLVSLKQLTIFPNRLVMYLTISDALAASTYYFMPIRIIVGWYSADAAAMICVIEGYSKQLFFVMSFSWMACIATNVLVASGFGKRSRSLEVPFAIYSLSTTVVVATVLLFTRSYGVAGAWCWIKAGMCGICAPSDLACLHGYWEEPSSMLPALPELSLTGLWNFCIPNTIFGRFFSYYGYLIAVIIYTSVVYITVGLRVFISSRRSGNVSSATNKELRTYRRLSLYLLSFVLIRSPSIANRAFQLVFPHYRLYVLDFLHAACSPLQGFVNVIVYGFNENLIRRLGQLCKKSTALETAAVSGALVEHPSKYNFEGQAQESTTQNTLFMLEKELEEFDSAMAENLDAQMSGREEGVGMVAQTGDAFDFE